MDKDKVLVEFQSTPSAWRVTILFVIAFLPDGISIHTLRVEGDGGTTCSRPPAQKFQSTPSAWRVTHGSGGGEPGDLRISIHTLRVEGDVQGIFPPVGVVGISIHTLRVEGDARLRRHGSGRHISIHTLRVEGDRIWRWRAWRSSNFNLHPPRGG